MLKWIHISKTVITTWHHAVTSDLTSLSSDMPLNTWTEIYPPFSNLNTVSANTTTDIFYKYIRISDSFCLCFFFSWHKSFTQSKKRSSHIQTAILPLQDESRNGQESNACQIMAICKKVNSKLFSLCRTLSFN